MTAERAAAYRAQLDAEQMAMECDIGALPAVLDRKLAYYDACAAIAQQRGDDHGARNWRHTRQRALVLRECAGVRS